jgi:rRNA maturation RNase YbeY
MSSNSIFFFNVDIQFRLRKIKLVRKWVFESLISENKVPGEISVVFCSDDYLLKMNYEYLKHDTFTDIITFDYSDSTIVNGDLFISIDRVRENSKIFKKTLHDELHRVIIHGILHLCGYDDKTKKKRENMTRKENYYLNRRPNELYLS